MRSSGDVLRWAEMLRNPDPAARQQAAEQLARLGPQAQTAALALVQACADDSAEVGEWVVNALEEIGPPAARDVRPLAHLLGHDSADVGYWAATLLGRLGAHAVEAVPALTAALLAPLDDSVRQRAAWALGKIGPSAEGALATLEEAADDEGDPRLARQARRAIQQIRGPV